MRQRALLLIVAVAAWSAGCASLPAGTYYPSPADPNTVRVAHILHRAAMAAGDDPTRYSFAFIKSQHAAAYTDEDATFYITDGLARLPSPVLEAAVAHEVAHEVLDHVGTRRRLALSLNAGFGTAGFFAPGVGLLDFVVNPLVVRAFSRQHELAADQRAIEILRAMGNPCSSALATRAGACSTPIPPSRTGSRRSSRSSRRLSPRRRTRSGDRRGVRQALSRCSITVGASGSRSATARAERASTTRVPASMSASPRRSRVTRMPT